MSKKIFPYDFDAVSELDGAKHIADDDVTDMVNRVRKMLKQQEREDPEDYSACYMSTGDTLIFGQRHDDCKTIYVCQGYYELNYAYRE